VLTNTSCKVSLPESFSSPTKRVTPANVIFHTEKETNETVIESNQKSMSHAAEHRDLEQNLGGPLTSLSQIESVNMLEDQLLRYLEVPANEKIFKLLMLDADKMLQRCTES
jgi:hypothetical protein